MDDGLPVSMASPTRLNGEPGDSALSARAAGLRYVDDSMPGYRRVGRGARIRYVDADGRVIRDRGTLTRIGSLAVPPAWTDVWICPAPNGHLQATGRDARDRKQYRYHARWRSTRDATKFSRMVTFGTALPRIRRRVTADLARPGMDRMKVLALVVRLLELTLIRVGNDEYARSNRSYGLTTLRNRHVRIDGPHVVFRFRGKSGRSHEVDVRDPRLARAVRRCHDLPGQELFQYVDADGIARAIGSEDVNEYLREAGRGDFTAKDFRTWTGTMLAYRALRAAEHTDDPGEAKHRVVESIDQVAEQLGNTRAVCRASYVHPVVIEAFMDGALIGSSASRQAGDRPATASRSEERALLSLLRRRQHEAAKRPRRQAP